MASSRLPKLEMSESELNGNITERTELFHTSSSVEDLSVYTDADESLSAPTEILSEFLSAIMMKDYERALKYCTLILSYEPNNSTAKDFYPLIVEKLETIRSSCDDSFSDTSDAISSSSLSSDSKFSDPLNPLRKQLDSDGTTASYSSLEDYEADFEFKAYGASKVHFSSVDIVNGNSESFHTGLSIPAVLNNSKPTETIVEGEKKTPGTTSKEGSQSHNVKKTVSVVSHKILMHPTPTRTLHKDSCHRLTRTQTYVKSLACPTPSPTHSPSSRNNNKIHCSPNRKYSQKKKISSSTSSRSPSPADFKTKKKPQPIIKNQPKRQPKITFV